MKKTMLIKLDFEGCQVNAFFRQVDGEIGNEVALSNPHHVVIRADSDLTEVRKTNEADMISNYKFDPIPDSEWDVVVRFCEAHLTSKEAKLSGSLRS